MEDFCLIDLEIVTERFCKEKAHVYKTIKNITTQDSFENNTVLEYLDEVFSVSTEELMFSMGVQMCHHNVVGHLLDNP